MSFLDISRGESPLILGLPHTGTHIPTDVQDVLNETGLAKADTDWHVHKLYANLHPETTCVRTQIHRYVIDVNRDPAGQSLYPGQNTTELCPTVDFDGQPLYQSGKAPNSEEIAERLRYYHRPYHAAIEAEIDRVKAIHGFAILYDCHSIRSQAPYLFDGKLPDFNIGTNAGKTCHPSIQQSVLTHCEQASDYTHVLNGRFKGGWTTRHYGQPEQQVHAIQMELAQSTYMRESPPWTYHEAQADKLRTHLSNIINALANWRSHDF